MRLFITLILFLTLTLSACGGRTNTKFENLTPEQKQVFITEEKRKYIHSLVCEKFGDEIFRYKQDKANRNFSHLHKYFYDYPFHFNILQASGLYELRKRQVQLMLEAKGIYGFDADFKDWSPPLMSELNCDERLNEWANLRDEWENLRKVLPIEMYKQFTLWDSFSYWLDDATDWLSKLFYATLAFLIIAAVTIYAAALHYELLIKKNRDGLWLFLVTPLSALYFQKHLKSILDSNSTFWWRLLIASVLLSLLFSCIAFLSEKLFFKNSKNNSSTLQKLKTPSQVLEVLHEQLRNEIDSQDIARIDDLLSVNTDSLKFFDINGLTPFHYLISKGQSLNESDFLIAELMISFGADVNLPTHDEKEWTPLHMISALGEHASEFHEKFTKLLLENGANPDATTRTGFTPLHFIAINGSAESMGVLNQLIKFHPNPFATTTDGVTSWRMLWQHGQEVFDALEDYEKRYF
jgi:hypothetical protein